MPLVSMTRKDSEKEAERPHYYSQFWLDVAAGRKVIGAKANEEAESPEPEDISPIRRGGRASVHEDVVNNTRIASDGRGEAIVHPVVEPVTTPEEYIEPEPDLDAEPEFDESELIAQDEDLEYQDVAADEEEVPDVDLTPVDEEEDYYDEEEEEEDEGLDWGRGRKRNKPTRTPKQPPKKGRRDRRTY